jgi:hypothetical protein
MTFSGTGTVTTNWNVAANGSSTGTMATGSYTVTTGCTATATVSDSSGNSYPLTFTITSATGSNFIVSGSNAQIIFSGSGRIL